MQRAKEFGMSYRIMQKFWLDLEKPDHEEVNEIIHALKRARSYSKAIRDGLRLIFDLSAGNLDVLFELFPWVRAEFMEYITSVQPQKPDTGINIQEQLARIEELLANSETLVTTPKIDNRVGEPKAMKVPPISVPIFDKDEDLLVVTKAKSDGSSAKNFLDSAFSLIQ